MSARQILFAPTLARKDLRELLKVTDRTLSRMIARGDIPEPAFRSGKTVRWRADQFPELLTRANEQTSTN